MPVKSLEELKKLKEQAVEKRQAKATTGNVQVIVAMGTCGIAAGARDTMKAILAMIETKNLSGIVVSQTGCMGMCEQEPIVQVKVADAAPVVYGKVSAEKAIKIMQEHVIGGKTVDEFKLR